jgi:hypothetical protein
MPRSLPVFSLTLGLALLVACAAAEEPAAGELVATSAPSGEFAADTSAVLAADPATLRTFERLMGQARAEGLAERPIGEVIQVVAERLLGVPYVAHMLDQSPDEELVVSLTGFDCVLYVEKVLALAQAIKTGRDDYASFARNVEALRYRDGRLRDYCSRLHYFSDWMGDNDRRGKVEVVTAGLTGAAGYPGRVTFMSNNRHAYRLLATDDEALACIRGVEADLNTVELTYIPQDRIARAYGQLQAGDVIAITTSVGGLDIAHTGFVYKFPDGRTGFIHASTTGRVIRNDDLAQYVRGNRSQTGIMVARPLEPAASR